MPKTDLLRDWLETVSYANTPAPSSPDRPWWTDPQYDDDPDAEADQDDDEKMGVL